MLRLINAIYNKPYRIKKFDDFLQYSKIERYRKRGFVEEVKVIVKEMTSYEYLLIEYTHPNGEIKKFAVSKQDAQFIYLERYELDNNINIVELDVRV